MAVPTFVRILPAGTPVGTPAEGPTAGRVLVEIYGGGFRLPPTVPPGPSAPPVNGVVYAEEQRTVAVRFGTAAALRVDVIRSNLLRVIVPPTPLAGAGAVDVTIENLDDFGNPIAGESITIAGGYTYRLVKLDATTESDFMRLVRQVIREWKRQVIPEVVLTQHTDYDPDTSTSFVEVAKTPAIVLSGPNTPENRFYSLNENAEVNVGGMIEIRRKARTVDLVFRVLGITDTAPECLNLMALAIEFMNRNPYLEMDRDPADLSKGRARWEFAQTQEFQVGTRANESNIHFFTGEVTIRGFDVEAFAGFSRDDLIGLSSEVEEVIITATSTAPNAAGILGTLEGDVITTSGGDLIAIA